MNTIKISVKSGDDVQLLIRLLRSMNMVLSAEEELIEPGSSENQYQKLNNILTNYASPSLFSKIDNPVSWQREIRDEWQ